MRRPYSIVPRLLLCPLAGIGFILATSLGRLLGGLLSAAHPVNWFTDPTQLPMPVTLIAFLLLLILGSGVGTAIMGAGCTIGAVVGGWACSLPVDYSHGYPLNYRGGYVDGGMAELVIGAASILLAILVPLLISGFRKWRESASPAKGSSSP